MSKCKGCHKEIVWGKTIDGKFIPLDPKAPVYEMDCDERTDPNIPQKEDSIPINRTHSAYVTHFATCPKANDFSASRKP